METHAPNHSAYKYVEWSGRAPIGPPPVTNSQPRDFDTTQVWLLNDRQLRYWTGELGVTMYEIRGAIATIGTRCAIALRNYVGR